MKYTTPATSAASACACPLCGGPLKRVARRPYDRLASLFTPVYRYRCDGFQCRWEGTLPVSQADLSRPRVPGVRTRYRNSGALR
jgi:hypothetical protein